MTASPTPPRIDAAPPGPVDLRRVRKPLSELVPGYGLTPSSARERAAVVKAVTDDTRIRQRPMPVVVATAVITLIALAVWGWQLYVAITENGPLTLVFWAALATFLVAGFVCSWAWQLYDVQKAIVMWFAIAVLGIAAALIIVLVLVAVKGDGDVDLDLDLDGWLDKITGSSAAQHPASFVNHVVLPAAMDTADAMGWSQSGYQPMPDQVEEGVDAAPTSDAEDPDARPCPTCGAPVRPGRLVCPSCGTALEG
ncbi:MAG: zinc ribbon domain-containing protein [Chloroflexota bacterium]